MGRVASASETGGDVWAGVLAEGLNATTPPDLDFVSATLPIKGGKAYRSAWTAAVTSAEKAPVMPSMAVLVMMTTLRLRAGSTNQLWP